jgi:hypothetical protein
MPTCQGTTIQQIHSEQNPCSWSTFRPRPPRHHHATHCTRVAILSDNDRQILPLARSNDNEGDDNRICGFSLLNALISHFGAPNTITTDQSSQFESVMFTVMFANDHRDSVTGEGVDMASRTILPAPVARKRISRTTEAQCQPAYKRGRQKQLILLPWELDYTHVAVVTSCVPCKWSVLLVLMKYDNVKHSDAILYG